MPQQLQAWQLAWWWSLFDPQLPKNRIHQIADPILQGLPGGPIDRPEAMPQQGLIARIKQLFQLAPLAAVDVPKPLPAFAFVSIDFVVLQPAIEPADASVREEIT